MSAIFPFTTEPAYADVQLNQEIWHRIWYYGVSSFTSSLVGNILNYAGYAFRDGVPLILKLTLNSLMVYLVKNYAKKLEAEKLEFTERISHLIDTRQNAVVQTNTNNFVSKTDRNQTYIACIMRLFSLFEHSFYTLGYALYFVNIFDLSSYFLCAAVFSIIIYIIINHFLIRSLLLT